MRSATIYRNSSAGQFIVSKGPAFGNYGKGFPKIVTADTIVFAKRDSGSH